MKQMSLYDVYDKADRFIMTAPLEIISRVFYLTKNGIELLEKDGKLDNIYMDDDVWCEEEFFIRKREV